MGNSSPSEICPHCGKEVFMRFGMLFKSKEDIEMIEMYLGLSEEQKKHINILVKRLLEK